MLLTSKSYAGIGSRGDNGKLPPHIEQYIAVLGKEFAERGLILRSGAADGCDAQFESAAISTDPNSVEIFLPFKGFNNHTSPLYRIPQLAYDIAEKYHPAWSRLSSGAKKMIARDGQQVLGEDLQDPVDFVICWTPDGANNFKKTTKDTGGTGQAIRIATDLNICVVNLANLDVDLTDEELVETVLTYIVSFNLGEL